MNSKKNDSMGEVKVQGEDEPPSPRAPTIPILLTVAGFDPSSGAGVTADLKVFAAHRKYGMACVTALTVQSTQGVRSVEPVPYAVVEATLRTLSDDVEFSGIKVGMLANAEIGEVVSKFLNAHPEVPVVLDPVVRSSSGRELLDPAGVRLLRDKLLARIDWITPNLDELAALTGLPADRIEEIPSAAARLQILAREAGNVKLNIVVTGGHFLKPDDYLLTSDGAAEWIEGNRIDTVSTHGTGCAYSSALLCRVAGGDSALDAATRAKDYVTGALAAAYAVGRGRGPIHHLFNLSRGA